MNHVFCIDDDPVTLTLCRIVILQANFAKNISTASNGEEAIEILKELKSNKVMPNDSLYPDLIFLDLNMPIMDGWEFLDEFNRSLSDYFSETKIIILSSSVDEADRIKAESYPNIMEFISKPIHVKLIKDLETLLQERKKK
ncbi:response regulator [Leptospira idonii]|uniref:Response regulator n=1 Tax=Leptospira idonii TaxID=1193500 RepID=A0A4R9M1T8_9LEPT|nr:response regulator [Leptospira idonii]TGN20042.1 response regulator [Leptospira idonii]